MAVKHLKSSVRYLEDFDNRLIEEGEMKVADLEMKLFVDSYFDNKSDLIVKEG